MPTSTEKGFSLSKWESKYLHCRYRAHRNKVAAAKPAIDCSAPPERPHVQYKNKKALQEDQRQISIIHENLRVLNKTAEIMTDNILPLPSSPSSSASSNISKSKSATKKETEMETEKDSQASSKKRKNKVQFKVKANANSKSRDDKSRPITAMMRRNTHILLQWFLHKSGRYFPWWAELRY